jgi:hypothetical protein
MESWRSEVTTALVRGLADPPTTHDINDTIDRILALRRQHSERLPIKFEQPRLSREQRRMADVLNRAADVIDVLLATRDPRIWQAVPQELRERWFRPEALPAQEIFSSKRTNHE